MGKVDVSYGRPTGFGGMMYGAGYGTHENVSKEADKLGKMIAKAFPKNNYEVRCNTDGLSCGARYDGEYDYGLGVGIVPDIEAKYLKNWGGLKPGELAYDANFNINPADLAEVKKKVPHHQISSMSEGNPMVCSKQFRTAREALSWLRRYGRKYCPSMR
jgi:hypothetical protein